MLLKHGDIKFTEETKKYIEFLSEKIKFDMKEFPKVKVDFITEACPNRELHRRVDLVKLDTDTRIEFETNHKVKKDNSLTVYI